MEQATVEPGVARTPGSSRDDKSTVPARGPAEPETALLQNDRLVRKKRHREARWRRHGMAATLDHGNTQDGGLQHEQQLVE